MEMTGIYLMTCYETEHFHGCQMCSDCLLYIITLTLAVNAMKTPPALEVAH